MNLCIGMDPAGIRVSHGADEQIKRKQHGGIRRRSLCGSGHGAGMILLGVVSGSMRYSMIRAITSGFLASPMWQ